LLVLIIIIISDDIYICDIIYIYYILFCPNQ